jgi:hypothetical protein
MTPIDYIRIDADVLALDLSDKSKMLLGLIKSFDRGLGMSNSELGELLNCSDDNISRIIRELNAYIKIKNPQSRYRKIFYSGRNAEVKTGYSGKKTGVADSTPTFEHATLTFKHATPAQMPDITKGTKITKNISTQEQVVFDSARKLYPGTKRGLKTEFDNFQKKHKDWREVLSLLKPAIEQQSRAIWAGKEKQFIPHFKTWIDQRRWEQTDGRTITPEQKMQNKQAALEKRRQEIRNDDGQYYRERTTDELQAMLKDKNHIIRHWLIREILKEKVNVA